MEFVYSLLFFKIFRKFYDTNYILENIFEKIKLEVQKITNYIVQRNGKWLTFKLFEGRHFELQELTPGYLN